MKDNFTLTTPVALAIFNRPDTTLKVFERIRKARPQKLFIYSDGARENKPGEAEKVQQCRAIKDMVDWKCKVYVNFSDKNLGCRRRMSSGISWVFEHVEEAIILEDDCLPSMSFFRFCQELLKKYRNDTRVTSISGSNHCDMENFNESYAFSNYFRCWGWATWKRAWKLYDDDMKMWNECRKNEWLRKVYPQDWRYTYMTNEFQMAYNKQLDSWAYRFMLANILNHALAIVPRVNMVRNIGFKEGATHTVNFLSKDAFYMEEDLQFPLVHPQVMFSRDKTIAPPPYISTRTLCRVMKNYKPNLKRDLRYFKG